jgi:formate hydrogenlyase subunit 6/NADH:ubiquinone oxidoreductase subunit I
MGLFRSFFYLLPQIWRALWRGPETIRYPFGPLTLPEGFRGAVSIHAERCRGCSLCVRDCPAAALELRREGRDTFTLLYYPDRCAYCGQCELSCQFGAIYLSHTFTSATADRDTLVTVLVERRPD